MTRGIELQPSFQKPMGMETAGDDNENGGEEPSENGENGDSDESNGEGSDELI